MRARRAVVAGVLVLAGGGAGAGLVVARGDTGAPAEAVVAPPTTTPVRTMDLVDQESVTGSLGYGTERTVGARAEGTLTWVPAVGAGIAQGQPLYEADAVAVRMLHGERPMWRRLASGMTDGEDVRQLEQALLDLGAAKGTGLAKADEEWTASTTLAVQRWQKSIGVPTADRDGVVEVGEIVFLPSDVRVSSVSGTVGAALAPGATVLGVSRIDRVVEATISVAKATRVKVGDQVGIELPDRSNVVGHVSAIGTTATAPKDDDGSAGDASAAKVVLTITVDDQRALGTLTEAPVDVLLTKGRADHVLAVPVTALLALAEGGYGVEKVDAEGRHVVTVETGLFAGSSVEVRGDLRSGDAVVVPS